MNIFLACDKDNAVIASYWEYYFKCCGIWVIKKKFKENLEIPAGFRGLAIIGSRKVRKYPAAAASYDCLVTDAQVFELGNVILKKEEGYYKSVIKSLFGEFHEYRNLVTLFAVFSENHLWKACWLYEEFAKEDTRRWDKEILQICEKGLASIRKMLPPTASKENRPVSYMYFYFRYVQCGTEYRTLSMRLLKCRELLDEYMPVLGQYSRDAMFQHLAGRICELSCIENKQAVFFYQKAVKYLECSEILYDIGHSVEKVYRKDELALSFYRKAYMADKDNYKALYKLASGYEIRKEWIDAFCLYGAMERKLGKAVKKNYESGSAVSIKEIEYFYKACRRLGYIYKQIFGCGDVENGYSEKMGEIKEKYSAESSFQQLAAFMDDPGKGGEIAEEIGNNFKGRCYQ